MHILLDHISALLIVSVLVAIFALIQLRGSQSTSDVAVNYMVRTETLEIADMLERDLLNMRTKDQTDAAIAAGKFFGGGAYVCTATAAAAGDTTLSFTFPTLSDPQGVGALADPDSADVSLVTYQLIPVPGQSIDRMQGNSMVSHPLFRLERRVGVDDTGSSQATVTYFNIDYGRVTGDFIDATGGCPGDQLKKIRFQVQMARQSYDEATGDQTSRSQLNFSRYGQTVELANFE